MSRCGLRELARKIGITENALRKAINDGRITSYIRSHRGIYEFDPEIAIKEYELNTNQILSSNSRFDIDETEFDEDEDVEQSEHENAGKKSILDKDPKFWNVNEAIQARNIFAALKAKHELEVVQSKFYDKKEADAEFVRITNAFTRGLTSLSSKIKQKIPDLTEKQLSAIKDLCVQIAEDCEKQI